MPADTPEALLYLDLAPGESAEARLDAALAVADFAAVLLRVPPHRAAQAGLRTLVAKAQQRGAAVLIEADADLARSLDADGVHLPSTADLEDAFARARRTLKDNASVGIDAGSSRHDAMALAEAGADYIAFARSSTPEGDVPAFEAQLDRVAWWGEIFQVPCVALGVTTPEEAEALAAAGADFISIAAEAGLSPDALADRIRAIEAVLPRARPRPGRTGAGGRP